MLNFKEFFEAKSEEAKKFGKSDKNKTVLKLGPISIGHQPHTTGTGVHLDKREKRNKTRKNQNEKAIKDSWN